MPAWLPQPHVASKPSARRTRRPCPTPKTPPPCATSSTSWSPTTKAANNDFDALYTARADERYARNTSAPDMKVARAAMEAAYADVADIVNALYIQSTVLAPDEETLAEVTAIATTVNALISQYTLVLSRRGVGKTTDDTTDTDTPDEGGTDTPQPEPEEPGGDEGEGGSPL